MKKPKVDIPRELFWYNLLLVAETEPQETKPIRGASGQIHDVLALGLDEKRKRLVLVSGEHDARAASLVQYDIQSAIKDMQVITVRPAVVSLPKICQLLNTILGKSNITKEILESLAKKDQISKRLVPDIINLSASAKLIKLDWVPQIIQLTTQIAQLELHSSDVKDKDGAPMWTLDFKKLLDQDPIAKDREYGVCPIPIYDFSGDDILRISLGKETGEKREILRKHDILQFFFPGADSLALGLTDRGVHNPRSIQDEIKNAPSLGHPIGALELLDKDISPLDVIDALKERELLVDGEYGVEISEKGAETRFKVKFKPKESIISRLINQISVRVDLKSIFGK